MVKKFNARSAGVILIATLPYLAFAQQHAASAPSQSGTIDHPASMSKPELRAQQKADRKAARKQARQAKNAQLKSLEQQGYGPSADPNQYPENFRNAEKNARQQKQAPSPPASGN
ncbi:hypothetical protein [Caballeronia sordidicola]|uniref:hypothetical protein n=1 Tax=Caballeronia sordidicola TaxID=196367 RepID=UPI00068D0E90|nr:hypothetical protein [Caballeronia sordidicola]